MQQSLWYILKYSSSLDSHKKLNIVDEPPHNQLRMFLQYLNLGNSDSVPSTGFHRLNIGPAHFIREFLAFEVLKP